MRQHFAFVLLAGLWSLGNAFLLQNSRCIHNALSSPCKTLQSTPLRSATDESSTDAAAPSTPAPVLDGKRVLPYKIMKSGLKGHTVAGVYALLNSDYKRGTEGWESVEFVGTTMDMDASLEQHVQEMEAGKVAHVRALTFAIPSKAAMEDRVKLWRKSALEAGGLKLEAADYLLDDDDDGDDDDDDEFDPAMMASASAAAKDIVSPFDPSESNEVKAGGDVELTLTKENVDKVLDEVRPYLIADGGNVAVEAVEPATGIVYLKLEGACGTYS